MDHQGQMMMSLETMEFYRLNLIRSPPQTVLLDSSFDLIVSIADDLGDSLTCSSLPPSGLHRQSSFFFFLSSIVIRSAYLKLLTLDDKD